MEKYECKPEPVEKKEKPVEELMNWDAYYKNRGLVSTRLGSCKADYNHHLASIKGSQGPGLQCQPLCGYDAQEEATQAASLPQCRWLR